MKSLFTTSSNFPGDPSWLVGTRSPTLRDLIKADGETLNGGMFHSGQAISLRDIFGHYEFRRLDTIDNTNLDPRLTRIRPSTGERIGLLLNSNAMERRNINAFLATLTGRDVYTNEKWSNPFDSLGNISVTGEGITSTISHTNHNNDFIIYPNPTTSQFTISGELDWFKIEILNSKGQVIKLKHFKTSNDVINVSKLADGIYIVRIFDAKYNLIGTRKIIKTS